MVQRLSPPLPPPAHPRPLPRRRYSELCEDARVRAIVFGAISAEHERSVRAVLLATGAGSLLESQPALAASIRSRSAYLDPLNVCQVELLRASREGQRGEKLLRGIHLSINGVASGLRNSG